MSKALNINYDILAKRNHKELLVKKFYRFINKAITIAVEDKRTNDIFFTTSIATEYAWKSSPMDETDILRSVSIIG